MKKFAIIILISALLALASCGKIADGGEPQNSAPETLDPNAPDNVVAGGITAAPPENAPATAPTEPAVSETLPGTAPGETAADETEAEETSAATEAEEPAETEPEEPDAKAFEYLKKLNSDFVHAKFIQAESSGGNSVITTSVEYFVKGGDRIYTVNAVRRIISGGTVTVVDNLNRFYMVYPDDSERGLDFGYELSKYRLVSSDENSETYEIEGEDITSTWDFSGGSIKVSDVRSDGSFILYDVETVDEDFSDMDYSVPSDYDEVDAEEYDFYG